MTLKFTDEELMKAVVDDNIIFVKKCYKNNKSLDYSDAFNQAYYYSSKLVLKFLFDIPKNNILTQAKLDYAAEKNNIEYIKNATSLFKDFNLNKTFETACLNNSVEVVSFLISCNEVNPAFKDNRPARLASKVGNLEILKILLKDKRVDASDYNNDCISWAISIHEYMENFKFKKEVILLLLQQSAVRKKLREKNDNQSNKLLDFYKIENVGNF